MTLTYSSDAGGLLIGHTDVLSRTEEQRGQMEVSCLHSCRISFSLARVSKIFENEKETNKWASLIFEDGGWIPFKMITINEFYTEEQKTESENLTLRINWIYVVEWMKLNASSKPPLQHVEFNCYYEKERGYRGPQYLS